jgi:Domain of unknown function (DUF1990)
MPQRTRPTAPMTMLRWSVGLGVVSWRYMWETMPLYRTESADGAECCWPPALPENLMTPGVQRSDEGVGPLFHRRFQVRVSNPTLTAERLMAAVADDFGRFVPSEVVGIRRTADDPLRAGDELVVQMPGPWNGPVVVVHEDGTCLRLATLAGHLESGQVQFHATEQHDLLTFDTQAWARPSTRLVHLLYSRMRLAKEIQLNMWVRFCLAAAAAAGGAILDGVRIVTHRADHVSDRPGQLRPG